MHSISNWKLARSPNYDANNDYQFPYSEVPYLGEYKLVKIPFSLDDLIGHIDYWGEGRVKTEVGDSGFSNCYNVNHPYRLVSNGSDKDRKIPNRIPVLSYTDCDTSSYVKDNSVLTVTVMGAPINRSCAKDIARIVNNDLGKVVVYGFDSNSQDIKNLEDQLMHKGLFYCPSYELSDILLSVTSFDNFRTYINALQLKNLIYERIVNSNYDFAVETIKSLSRSDNHKNIISDIVNSLLNNNKRNIMAFAYKLWHTENKNIVTTYFPTQFKLIFNEDQITIVNKQYNQALKLDAKTDRYNDRLVWGDSKDKTSRRVRWKIIPIWDNNDVTFKLYNIDRDMYLKMDVNVDNIGDRRAWGSTISNEERHKYYLKPLIKDNELVFFIINYKYNQALKLDASADSMGDRLLWGHNGSIHNDNERLKWIFAAF